MKVYKYPLGLLIDGITVLELPGNLWDDEPQVISAGVQNNDIVVWASVAPDSEDTTQVQVKVVPTGGEVEESGWTFIQTIFIDWMVFHIFVHSHQ